MNLANASRIATAVLVVTVVSLLFRHSLFADKPVALALQFLALLLMLWARLTFGRRSFHISASPTEGGLVTTGPYRYWRHPIYAAILVFVWAGVASHMSPLNLLIALVASLATGVRIGAEERLVRDRYPEYAAYAARTKRLLPFVF